MSDEPQVPPFEATVDAPLPPPREPFWDYSDLLLFLFLSPPCMILGLVLARAVMYLFRLTEPMRVVEILTPQLVGYLLLFGTLLTILRTRYGRPFWVSLGWVQPRMSSVLLMMSGAGTAIVVAIVAYLIGVPTTTNPMIELLKDRASIIIVAIFGITMGPLFEELTFRGFIQPLFVRSLGTVVGILATSVPFGALHYWEYGKSWKHVLVISLAGAMFGWMRHATGSTKASTIMHAAYNGLLFAGLLAQENTKPGL